MSQAAYQLIIGNKNTSSWSLRPWLIMTRIGLAFDEIHINLRDDDAKQQILAQVPSGLVPALKINKLVIWDSLAIMEYLADIYPDAALWPENTDARAIARSVSAEMHAGFKALRGHCPMDFILQAPKTTSPMTAIPTDVAGDVTRIIAIWLDCRRRYGTKGAFLFGEFSCADAMYAPVVSRFASYFPDLTPYGDDGTATTYIATMMALPEMLAWGDAAAAQVAELSQSASDTTSDQTQTET